MIDRLILYFIHMGGGRTLQILVIKPLIILIYKHFDTCILMYIQCIVVITATFLEFSYGGCFSEYAQIQM